MPMTSRMLDSQPARSDGRATAFARIEARFGVPCACSTTIERMLRWTSTLFDEDRKVRFYGRAEAS
jgi:hypothetical protein